MMAGMSFIQFKNWDELVEHCKINSYKIVKNDGFSTMANVYNSKDALIGYISNKPQDFKPISPNTKYVLVWE